MTAISVVLDASNIAFTRGISGKSYDFSRVEAVRDAWHRRDPDGQVHAVIDAGVRNRLMDKDRAARAEADGWLEVAPGDADDIILRLADRYGAAIVSKDKFKHARDDYPWLQGCDDRIFWIFRGSDGTLQLRRHPIGVADADAILAAKRKKAAKAGIARDVGDRVWRCTAPDDSVCEHAGRPIPSGQLQHHGDRWYCQGCQYDAVEIFAADPVTISQPPSVSLMYHNLFQREYQIPAEGLVFGRGGSSRPHVVDVTDGLPRADAIEISSEHLRLFLDGDGRPIAVHAAPRNASFLNATIDASGLPANNRLAGGYEYPLSTGDVLLLGPGVIRLVVSADGSD